MYGRSNGVTFGLGASLGSFQDTIVAATAGQTTKVLTHTPANQTDIEVWLNGWPQDNANITALAGKTVTFTALALNDQVIFRYTRVD